MANSYLSLLCNQARELDVLLEATNKVVKRAYGGIGRGPVLQPDTGVIVATIEKANLLVNAMLEDDSLSQLCCIVVR